MRGEIVKIALYSPAPVTQVKQKRPAR